MREVREGTIIGHGPIVSSVIQLYLFFSMVRYKPCVRTEVWDLATLYRISYPPRPSYGYTWWSGIEVFAMLLMDCA